MLMLLMCKSTCFKISMSKTFYSDNVSLGPAMAKGKIAREILTDYSRSNNSPSQVIETRKFLVNVG